MQQVVIDISISNDFFLTPDSPFLCPHIRVYVYVYVYVQQMIFDVFWPWTHHLSVLIRLQLLSSTARPPTFRIWYFLILYLFLFEEFTYITTSTARSPTFCTVYLFVKTAGLLETFCEKSEKLAPPPPLQGLPPLTFSNFLFLWRIDTFENVKIII